MIHVLTYLLAKEAPSNTNNLLFSQILLCQITSLAGNQVKRHTFLSTLGIQNELEGNLSSSLTNNFSWKEHLFFSTFQHKVPLWLRWGFVHQVSKWSIIDVHSGKPFHAFSIGLVAWGLPNIFSLSYVVCGLLHESGVYAVPTEG